MAQSAQRTTLQTRLEAHAWLQIQVAELSSRTTTSPLEATTPQKAAKPTSLRANLLAKRQVCTTTTSAGTTPRLGVSLVRILPLDTCLILKA